MPSIWEGSDIILLAQQVGRPTFSMVVTPDIHKVADLKGKKVAFQKASSSHLLTVRALAVDATVRTQFCEPIGHVQVSDSNRLEPGAGHVDWPLFCATLRSIGYAGDIAVESRLSGPAERALPGLIRQIAALLDELGLAEERISFRMSGCENW